MVSEVDPVKSGMDEASIRKHEEVVLVCVCESERSPVQPLSTGMPKSVAGKSAKNWVIGIIIWSTGLFSLVLYVWIERSKKSVPPRGSAAPESASISSHAPGQASSYSPVPTYPPQDYSHSSSDSEEMPPVGSGLIFNQAQIRYCLSENIRVSTWQEYVNNYSASSVGAFNSAVENYNTRCTKYRYRAGTLEDIRVEVEKNRYKLQAQGIANAMGNP